MAEAFDDLSGKSSPGAESLLSSAEVQRLWFATLRKPWSSLVVVPAHLHGTVETVGRALAEVARVQKPKTVKLISAQGCDLAHAARVSNEVSAHVDRGGLAIITVDSLIHNPAGIPLALAADAALLCVELGETDIDVAQRTIEVLGADRLLGAVIVH